MPDPRVYVSNPAFGGFRHLLQDPNLFHLNRHSVAGAFAVGLFIAFLPMVGQMPLAALSALWFRVNLPLSVALVWVSNPITITPIFYGAYELGRWILGTPAVSFSIELSWEWLSTGLLRLWQPLLVGSLIIATLAAISGYSFIQIFWRWQVLQSWEKRKQRRLQERR